MKRLSGWVCRHQNLLRHVLYSFISLAVIGTLIQLQLLHLLLGLCSPWHVIIPTVVFLLVFVGFPNYLLPWLWKSGKETVNLPKRYYDSLRTANLAIITVTGITLGIFGFSGQTPGLHLQMMFGLLLVSLVCGLLSVLWQITPNVKAASGSSEEISAPKITREIIFGSTFLQIATAFAGYVEASLAIIN